MRYIRIPKDRVGVLIGHNGETKTLIENTAKVKLEIDSKEGEVAIDEHTVKDPLLGLKTEDVVRAIGRGFSPECALQLFHEDADFVIFDIHDYVGRKESHIRRLKSRIIGRNGKTKRIIEELTSSHLSIYGHTVSIIADIDTMGVSKRAVDMLLSGSKHMTVYRFIEREMKKLRMEGIV